MGRQPHNHRQLHNSTLVRADVCHRLLDRLQPRIQDVQARRRARAMGGHTPHLRRRGHHSRLAPRPRVLLPVGLLLRAPVEDTRHMGGRARQPRRRHRHNRCRDTILNIHHQAQPPVDIRPPHDSDSPRRLPHTHRQPYEFRDIRLSHRPAVGIQVRALG